MTDRRYSKAQLDAMARQRGFPDYATWAAWHEKYRSTVRGKPKPETRNWFQKLIESVPVHPAYLMRYTHERMSKARKQAEK